MQICFRCSADFIQPSLHLFCDVVISLSVSINTALLPLFFDLHCGFTCLYDSVTFWIHMYVWLTSASWRLKLLKSSCSRSQYRGTVPFPVAKRVAELVFPLVAHTPEVARIHFTLIFPDLCLEGQNLSSQKLSLIDHFPYIKIHTCLRGLGNNEKRCIIHYWASRRVLLFCSPKPRSQVWILIYRDWSIAFDVKRAQPKHNPQETLAGTFCWEKLDFVVRSRTRCGKTS